MAGVLPMICRKPPTSPRSLSTSRLGGMLASEHSISLRARTRSIGLARYSIAPSFVARTAVSSEPCAVMTMTRASPSCLRICSSAASPSMPGSFTSTMTRSGLSFLTRSRPCSAVGAERKRCPSVVMKRSNAQLMDCSSSITRTVATRYLDPEQGALAARLEADRAAVILHDALRQRQTESHAVRLRRHERLEDAVAHRRGDAGPGVGDGEAHGAVARRQGERERAALRHRLGAVEDQVHHHPLEALDVHVHLRRGLERARHRDAQMVELPAHEV